MGWEDQLQQGMKLPERLGSLADDPFRGRHPTSHERMTGLPWDVSSGRPCCMGYWPAAAAIVRLASERGFAGTVLDAGCGTGENALLVASLGLSVVGVDVAETALGIAREKAGERGIEIEFVAANALHLDRLGSMFDTVLDCGLFRTFDGEERPGYVLSLASVTRQDGTLCLLCFSDDGPGRWLKNQVSGRAWLARPGCIRSRWPAFGSPSLARRLASNLTKTVQIKASIWISWTVRVM
jgi:SAM-dependent methyltransferase